MEFCLLMTMTIILCSHKGYQRLSLPLTLEYQVLLYCFHDTKVI